ncbi:MAG: response regulator [candidate division NC10 bacterium]|nr:response regulator [candidate division NC10 bacterium]
MSPEPIAKSAKVLIVEDNYFFIQLLKDTLGSLGCQVFVARNGIEALDQAWEHQPHLILLDVILPEEDGFAVAQILRGNERTKGIPIIFVTARVDLDDRKRGVSLGAVDYITKPLNPPDVLMRVRRALLRLQLPSLSSRLALTDKAREVLAGKRLAPSLQEKLQLFDGRHTIESILAAREDDVELLEFAVRLLQGGMVVVAGEGPAGQEGAGEVSSGEPAAF